MNTFRLATRRHHPRWLKLLPLVAFLALLVACDQSNEQTTGESSAGTEKERASDEPNVLGPIDVISSSAAPTLVKRVVSADVRGVYNVTGAYIDGDGALDLVTGGESGIRWWRHGDSTGSWKGSDIAKPEDYPGGVGTSIAVDDFDGDGDADVIALGDPGLQIFENDGSGSFTYRVISESFESAVGLHPVDVDADGDLDLFAASVWTGRVGWWRNDGEWSFSFQQISNALKAPDDLAVGQFDSDGTWDLVGVDGDAGEIRWWSNDGTGSFTEYSLGPVPDGVYDVESHDVDGDGDIDLVTSNWYEGVASIWENDGDGTFIQRALDTGLEWAGDIVVADVDHGGTMADSYPDILIETRDVLVLFRRLPDGTYERSSIDTWTAQISSLFVGPIADDGNGRDIVAVSHDNREVFWLEQAASVPDSELPNWNLAADVDIAAVAATSELEDTSVPDRYSVDKLLDGDPRTSWVEGQADSGVGEAVEFEFARPVEIDGLRIMPGYFDERFWAANNRVASADVTITDANGIDHPYRAEFSDALESQSIRFGGRLVWKLRIEIADVFAGMTRPSPRLHSSATAGECQSAALGLRGRRLPERALATELRLALSAGRSTEMEPSSSRQKIHRSVSGG